MERRYFAITRTIAARICPADSLHDSFGSVREPGRIEGDATGGLIPYKNPNALTAYYLGLFSLIPILGIVTGIAAVCLGIKGLRYAKQNPIVKGKVHAWVGILCGGFWALIYTGVIALLIPLFFSAQR